MLFRPEKVWAVMFAAFFFCSTAAQALHGGPFELDGNATDNTPGDPTTDDWQNIHNETSSAFAVSAGEPNHGGIVFDTFNPSNQDNVLSGGQTKDDIDLHKWKFKNAKPTPDKNNITNAYAAAYQIDTDGDLISELVVYFGADRFANTGDAQMGFWFFQNSVSATNGGFDNVHVDGDVLVLANFAGNGEVVVEVWEWRTNGGNNGNDNLFLLTTGGKCGEMNENPNACAITNPGGETSYWPYDPKSGAAGQFPERSFFEGSINLSKILPSAGCFSSFMAETRSSTSTDAVLKDFVLDEFSLCKISAAKSCDVAGLAEPNDPDNPDNHLFQVDATITVFNDGALPLPVGTIITVDDNPQGDSTDVPPIDVEIMEEDGPLNSGQFITVPVTFFSSDNPPLNSVDVSAVVGDTPLTAQVQNVECDEVLLSPNIDVLKTCDAVTVVPISGVVAAKVDFSVSVCNTGDVPLSVDVVDPTAMLNYSLNLDVGMSCNANSDCDSAPGEDDGICTGDGQNSGFCQNLPGVTNGGPVCDVDSFDYMPTSTNGDETHPGLAVFSNTVTVSGTHPALPDNDEDGQPDPVIDMSTANCALCPPPQPVPPAE